MATSSQVSQARIAYRHLIKAQRLAFGGDDRMIQAARLETRNAYQKASLEKSSALIDANIQSAFETVKALKAVVQAEETETPDSWRLRLREDQLGDNSTIKSRK